MDAKELRKLKKFSAQLRIDQLEMFKQRGMGHIGGCLSVTELISVLYGKQMKVDPKNPNWEGRDYLVMSKGHVVMEGTPKEVFSQTEKVRALRLDVPQAAELRDELVKAGIPLPEGIIDTGECAQALYELLK